MLRVILLIAVCLLAGPCSAASKKAANARGRQETERNNWAVLVDTSRYWYNYRHIANVLSFYHTLKRLGIPDSQIIVMMAEDAACNARNARPGTVFNEHLHKQNLYGEEVEVDYRGDEVSVENFIRLLTGRHPPSTPRNKRLLTDSTSNVFIYITGHSGEEFIKFQDWEEITSNDIADAFAQMHKQRRYGQIFWVSDTCQAATLQNQFYSPGILAIGSSGKKENSYSHHVDHELGIAVIDRFTFHAFDNMKGLTTTSQNTVKQWLSQFRPQDLKATPEMREDLFPKLSSETLLTEFLASTGRMRFQNGSLELLSQLNRNGIAQVSLQDTCSAAAAADSGSCSITRAPWFPTAGRDSQPRAQSRPHGAAEVPGGRHSSLVELGFKHSPSQFYWNSTLMSMVWEACIVLVVFIVVCSCIGRCL